MMTVNLNEIGNQKPHSKVNKYIKYNEKSHTNKRFFYEKRNEKMVDDMLNLI